MKGGCERGLVLTIGDVYLRLTSIVPQTELVETGMRDRQLAGITSQSSDLEEFRRAGRGHTIGAGHEEKKLLFEFGGVGVVRNIPKVSNHAIVSTESLISRDGLERVQIDFMASAYHHLDLLGTEQSQRVSPTHIEESLTERCELALDTLVQQKIDVEADEFWHEREKTTSDRRSITLV
jgi:hypothetical protein